MGRTERVNRIRHVIIVEININANNVIKDLQSELNFETQKKHDELKNQFCIENNYPILWIKYTDFGRVKELVSDFIIKHTDWGIEENQSSSTLSSSSSSDDD